MTERVRNVAFQKTSIEVWSDLDKFAGPFEQGQNHWVFRGMRCKPWPVVTSLERFAERWPNSPW